MSLQLLVFFAPQSCQNYTSSAVVTFRSVSSQYFSRYKVKGFLHFFQGIL